MLHARQHGLGRGASVRRLHIRRWLQTRYFSPASFPFDFYGRRKVSFGTMVLRCRQWSSLRKSGGPTLFDLFLKGERDNAHNSPPYFARQLSEGGDQFPVRPAAGSKAIAPLSCEWPFAVGNMLSYIARASLMRCARSSSDFGTNRTTSPMGFSKSKIRRHTWL